MSIRITNKSRIIYMLMVVIFLAMIGLFWLDFLGLISLGKIVDDAYSPNKKLPLSKNDDSSLEVKKEELKKWEQKLLDKEEQLNDKEAKLKEMENKLKKREDELKDKKKELEEAKAQFEEDKKAFKKYKDRIKDIAKKITNMPPEDAVKIMLNWEDLLIIDVLRQIDENARLEGTQSITSYLLSLMSKKNPQKVSNIVRKMSKE